MVRSTHALGKQSSQTSIEAKAECVTESDIHCSGVNPLPDPEPMSCQFLSHLDHSWAEEVGSGRGHLFFCKRTAKNPEKCSELLVTRRFQIQF